jgi:basic amino acid/polyamine antiporter, APA family
MRLKPVLGPIQLVFYGVGVIVGAGVYSVIGTAAGLAQQGLWASFVVGAGVAFLTAISYAEMATSYPEAGAEYVYVRRAWPKADWLSFGVGVVILLGGAATAATVAIGFGGYLRVFVDLPPALSALALLVACTALNIWGLRESSWVNMLFTSIEVGGLLLVIAAGLAREAGPLPPVEAQPAIVAAAALLFFVYLGFEEIANLVEEVRHPARDIPLALFSSMAITTVLYVFVALALVHMATPAELASSDAPLATAMNSVWPRVVNVLSGIALFATANTVLITVIATSRLTFSMARDGEIHGIFAGLLQRRQTPWVAATLSLVMAAVLLPIGSVKILAEISSFAALVAFLTVNLALITLRYTHPYHPRPFRVPGAVGRMPVLPVAAIASIVLLLIHFDWQIYVAGGIALVLTAIAFFVRCWVRVIRRRV